MNPLMSWRRKGTAPWPVAAWASPRRGCAPPCRSCSAVPVLGLWIYLAPNSGGYFPRDWYPAAILAVALAIVVGLATGRALPAARGARVALALLAAYVAWAYASLLWADSTGSALEASNKLLLLLALAWALALLPWDARSARWLLGAWSLGLAVVAVVSLAGASGHRRPEQVPLRDPLPAPDRLRQRQRGAGRHRDARRLRALDRPRHAPGCCAGCSWPPRRCWRTSPCSSQSRGSFVGVAVAAPVFLAFAPDRLRVGTRLLALAGAVALAAGPILNVYDTGEVRRARSAPPSTMRWRRSGPRCSWPVLPGSCSALAERAARGHERIEVASRRAGLAGAALLAAAVVALARRQPRPHHRHGRRAVGHAHRRRVRLGRGRADLEPRPVRAPRLLAGGDRPVRGVARERRGHRATSSASTRRAGTSPSTRATCTTCSCGPSARAASWQRPCSWRFFLSLFVAGVAAQAPPRAVRPPWSWPPRWPSPRTSPST